MPHETGVLPALTRFGASAKWVRFATVNEQMAGLTTSTAICRGASNPACTPSGRCWERFALRVNISAAFRIADPMPAARTVRNPGESLYRLLQLAVRRTLGTRTLDELLMEKVDIEPASAEEIRKEMAEVGVAVGTMALKDLIPPTEKAGSVTVTGGFDGMLEKLLMR